MSRPRPLSSGVAARGTLAQRLTRRVDRVRQLATKFGTRSRRVFLVWVQSTGPEVGAGNEVDFARRELLPTPRVADMTSLSRRPMWTGPVADGSLRVDQISAGWYTEDHLRGIKVPEEYGNPREAANYPGATVGGTLVRPRVREPMTFFYEVVEDGRGDDPPARTRYKLGSSPWRNETGAQWGVILEPMSTSTDRSGTLAIDADDVLDVPG
jgi:hypothetical protein